LYAIGKSFDNKKLNEAKSQISLFLASAGKKNFENLTFYLVDLFFTRKSNNYQDIISFLKGLLDNIITINYQELISEFESSYNNQNLKKCQIISNIFIELETLGINLNLSGTIQSKLAEIRKESKILSGPLSVALSPKALKELEGSLMQKNVDVALLQLRNILKAINKEKYERLIIYLIKLSLTKRTRNFETIITFLKGLLDDKINLNLSTLLNIFDQSYANKNWEKCLILENVFLELQKLGINLNLSSDTQTKLAEIRKKAIILSKDQELMANLYDILTPNNGVIIINKDAFQIDLDTFNKTYRKKSQAFKLNDNEIVVKDCYWLNPHKALRYLELGDTAFKNSLWQEAIAAYLKVLPLKDLDIRVYANLGISYMHLNDIKNALKFLRIATGLAKLKNIPSYDYSLLINTLEEGQIKNILDRVEYNEFPDTQNLTSNHK